MPHVAWTLTDNSTGTPEVFSFPVNPNDFDPPGRKAGVTWMRSTAPNGQPLIWQQINDVPEGKMTGAVLTQEFYEDLTEWATKWYPLTLTDDLGQTFDILIQEISWKRLNRHTHPWRHDYTITFSLIT